MTTAAPNPVVFIDLTLDTDELPLINMGSRKVYTMPGTFKSVNVPGQHIWTPPRKNSSPNTAPVATNLVAEFAPDAQAAEDGPISSRLRSQQPYNPEANNCMVAPGWRDEDIIYHSECSVCLERNNRATRVLRNMNWNRMKPSTRSQIFQRNDVVYVLRCDHIVCIRCIVKHMQLGSRVMVRGSSRSQQCPTCSKVTRMSNVIADVVVVDVVGGGQTGNNDVDMLED